VAPGSPSLSAYAKDSDLGAFRGAVPGPTAQIEIALLTGGTDKPYAVGLAMALLSKSLGVDFIGSDDVDDAKLHTARGLNFLNLRGGKRRDIGLAGKASRVIKYYLRLIRYGWIARPKIFHILWNDRLEFFDRTLLMLYYKVCGKRIAMTVHNVNAGRRDLNDSMMNRIGLRSQYRLCDHLFVHTDRMRRELVEEFGVRDRAITVIPFGINNNVPETDLTSEQARHRLGIKGTERALLFFGTIRPYKGLEHLVDAFERVAARSINYRLIIAGKPTRAPDRYCAGIQQRIDRSDRRSQIIRRLEYIPDSEVEVYFKAADVLLMPYRDVFQSGVLFLGYRFGLPVIATDVGSLREDIVEGKTGFVCDPCDPVGLAETIERYFESDLFKSLSDRRREIRDYASARHSWDRVADMTLKVYSQLLEKDYEGSCSRRGPGK
jgi:D-inositol-3-phosphate glycosyltransferase